jgi:hypothetical protein
VVEEPVTAQAAPATGFAAPDDDQLPNGRPFRLRDQVLIGIGAALVTPFTALAWPFALMTGFVLGRIQVSKRYGSPTPRATRALQVIVIAAGFIAMMVFGLALGGLISFLIVALAAESEKRAVTGTPRQYVISRAIVVGLPALTWLLLFSGPTPA